MVDLRGSPTLQTLAAFLVVYCVQVLGSLVRVGVGAFALSLPLSVRPWTLVLSTYAHAGPAHLVANALALLLVGLVVERGTTPARFHAFFVTTGALAGVAEVLLGAALGGSAGVIGGSGAVFGLLGYALSGNRVVGSVFGRVDVDRSLTLAVFVVVAVGLTAVTAAPGLALVAHFTGLLVGLLAGRRRLLRA